MAAHLVQVLVPTVLHLVAQETMVETLALTTETMTTNKLPMVVPRLEAVLADAVEGV